MMKRTSLLVVALALICFLPISCGRNKSAEPPAGNDTSAAKTKEVAREVTMPAASLKAAGIQVEVVGNVHGAVNALTFTGTVEPNQQQIQQVTPLVGGRVDAVYVSLGTSVRRGATLAVISSPEIAEMHGKLLESQAKLNQAEATLRRTEKLIEVGAAAGKDLIAARAEAETARLDVDHLRDALNALGAPPEGKPHNIATVALRSPIDGVVTERHVNPGSGAEANKPLFTVANLSTVWVIANVPEAQIALLRIGAGAQVHAAALGSESLPGRVAYIDPTLNESTRTARVRIDVRNVRNQLKVGMFSTVVVDGSPSATNALTAPDDAIQRMGDKTVVFVQQGPNSGKFAVREVTVGDQFGTERLVLGGLAAGERVVTKGAFTLKAQLLKSQFAEGD